MDCSDPEAAVFTCYLCSCQSNLCTCPASPRYQQGDAWACSKAVHPATTMMGGAVQQDDSAQQAGYQQGGYQQQDGSALLVRFGGIANLDERPYPSTLPYPWEQLADQNGAVYYSNPQTGEASWDPPQ